jgi:phage tail-like protein
MPNNRKLPYGAFNFQVEFGGSQAAFSDVQGLTSEVTVAEYRTGNERVNYTHKVPSLHKSENVTFKRGYVDAKDLWDWIELVRQKGVEAKREVVITLLNENGDRVQGWKLVGAVPLKYTGPTLAAKGGGDVAMEELVVSHEELQFVNA